jgi:3-phytase
MFNNRSIMTTLRMHRSTLLIMLAVLFSLSIGTLLNHSQPSLIAAAGTVVPAVETQPMPHTGDSADDPAIWVHPSNTSLSTIIGTNKQGGIAVYNITGEQIQYLADGKMNNVDLRYNVPVAGQHIALVTATNRTDNSLALYRVNPSTRLLENIAARVIKPGIAAYGACMYRSAQSGKYYVFVTSSSGGVEQWELYGTSTGKVDGTRVRSFNVGSAVEGCVVDDELARLYVSEETVGIWRYGAEPGAGSDRVLVDSVSSGTGLAADVEGLTIYHTSARTGYLMVSSQATSSYLVYQREGNNTYLDRFVIGPNRDKGIDAVQETDGIDVTNVNLGPAFSQGMFVVQDNANDVATSAGTQNFQNFKLVPWQAIANAFDPDLAIDTGWDPRKVGAPGPSPSPSPSPTPSPSPSPSPPPATGTMRVFTPVADARIEQANAGANFGDDTMLRTDGTDQQKVESYLQFAVSGITRPISSAKLRVYTSTSSSNGPGVYTSGTNWTESTITWNTAPTRPTSPIDNIGATSANTWIEYNVTPSVTQNGTYSFVLASSSSDGLTLSAREGSAQPQLVVTWVPYRTFIPLTQGSR